jgi:formylglycine-generating enzyme required for sulfatase activity
VFIYPRSVDIRPFEISEFEITYALWEAVRAEVPGYTLPQGNGGTAPANPFTPVTHVSWYDAVVWCNAYSEKEGYEPVYLKNGTPVKNPSDRASLDSMVPEWAKNGFRLPTEAEWELAARGGRFPQSLADAKLPPWGDRYAGSGKLAEVGWYLGNTRGSAQEVGLLLPVEIMNPNGQSDYLYDMSGNVLEWCWDWMGPIAWNTPATGPAAAHTDNPQNPNDDHWPGSRVIRGGRWNGPESEGAVRFRYFTGSEIKSNALGFRVARTL